MFCILIYTAGRELIIQFRPQSKHTLLSFLTDLIRAIFIWVTKVIRDRFGLAVYRCLMVYWFQPTTQTNKSRFFNFEKLFRLILKQNVSQQNTSTWMNFVFEKSRGFLFLYFVSIKDFD